LAKLIVEPGPLPLKAASDALHLAVAVVHNIDYVLTWNCRHLDNAELKPKV
jgi:predicted nucleic acid-binding protein